MFSVVHLDRGSYVAVNEDVVHAFFHNRFGIEINIDYTTHNDCKTECGQMDVICTEHIGDSDRNFMLGVLDERYRFNHSNETVVAIEWSRHNGINFFHFKFNKPITFLPIPNG